MVKRNNWFTFAAVFVVIFGIMTVFFLWEQQRVKTALLAAETQNAATDYFRIDEAVKNEISALQKMAIRAAADDALSGAVRSTRGQIAPSSVAGLNVAFSDYADLLIVTDAKGRKVYTRTYGAPRTNNTALRLLAGDDLSNRDFLLTPFSGLVSTEGGLLMLSSRPIMVDGVNVGTLLVGRFLTQDLQRQLAESLKIDYQILASDSPVLSKNEKSLADGLLPGEYKIGSDSEGVDYLYGFLPSILGTDHLLLKISLNAVLSRLSINTLSQFNDAAVIFLLLVVLGFAYLAQRIWHEREAAGPSLRPLKFWPMVSAVAGVGLAATLIFYYLVYAGDNKRISATFDSGANELADTIEKNISGRLDNLDSLRRFYDASNLVENKEFLSFTNQLVGSDNFQAVAWLPLVKEDERQAFVAQAHAEGWFKGEGLGQAVPNKKEYLPVAYLNPKTENLLEPGLDFSDNQVLRPLFEQARDTGKLAVSGRFVSRIFNSDKSVIFAVVPVYQKGAKLDDAAERHDSLLGFIVAVMRPDELVSGQASKDQNKLLITWLEDLSAPIEDRTLYYYQAPSSPLNPFSFARSLMTPRLELARQFDVDGRLWQIRIDADESYFVVNRFFGAAYILFFGLLGTLLLVLFVASSLRAWRRLEASVDLKSKALDLNQEKLRLFAENYIGIIYRSLVDSGALEIMEGSVKEITGYGSDDFLSGKINWWQLVHPDDWEAYKKFLAQAKDSQDSQELQYRIIKSNGQIVWIKDNCQRQDEAGEKALQGSLYDVSAIKEAESLCRRQKNLSRQLLDAMPMPIFYMNMSGTFAGCNQAFATLTGLQEQELVGKTAHELWPKSLADLYEKQERALYDNTKPLKFSAGVMVKGKGLQPADFNLAPYYNDAGQLVGAVATVSVRAKA